MAQFSPGADIEAERQFRKLQAAEERRPIRAGAERHTLDEVIDSLCRRLAVEGARKPYLQNCESMQRVHISPSLGDKAVDRVTIADVETIAAAMLDAGLAPKTVRNVITFMHSVFEHATDRGWTRQNPVRRASRPKRRRVGDANPDIHFLTVSELEAVLRAIPDDVVMRTPAPMRRGRAGRPRPCRQLAAGPAGCPRSGDPRRCTHGRGGRPAPVRVAWPALARRRLNRAAHPRAQRLGPRRTLVRGQVGPLDPTLGANGRPARLRAGPLVSTHALRR